MLLAGASLAVYLILVPLGMLLFAAFRGPSDYLPFEPGARWTLENFRAIYSEAALYQKILPDTLVFVAGTVALTFTVAFALAWLIERTDLAGREIWFAIILFPLLVPIPVLAIAWIFLMGPNAGWLNLLLRWLGGFDGPGPINVFSMPGLILCQSLASVPYVFILLSAALRTMNPALEEASGTSGATPLDDLPPRDAAGAAARTACAAHPDHADHRRAVRTAADDRPAVAHHRVQLSHLFRAQSGGRPAELRRRRGGLAAVRGCSACCCCCSTTA